VSESSRKRDSKLVYVYEKILHIQKVLFRNFLEIFRRLLENSQKDISTSFRDICGKA